MTEPLRRAPLRGKNPDELGDVLASIRRLIAQEGAALQDAGAGVTADARPSQLPTGMSAPVSRDPMTRDPVALRAASTGAPRPAQDSAALSLAVDAAAARMADTARRIEAARGQGEQAAAMPPAPFRLNPDALIPPAEQPAWADPQRRLTPGLLAEVATTPPAAGDASGDEAAPITKAEDARSLISDEPPRAGHPAAKLVTPPAATAGPVTPLVSPPDLAQATVAENHHADSHAAAFLQRATAAQPTFPDKTEQENAAMLLTADRAHATITPHPSAAAPLPSMAASAPTEAAPVAGEGLLVRQLLREAIRAELSAELGERLDGELRLLVRQEIAAALSAALSDALRLPATR